MPAAWLQFDWTIPLRLVAVALLVLVNGFFVASEFALVAIRRSRVEQLVAEDHASGLLLKHATEHLDAYLAATQLGITLASLGLGWIGEPTLARMLSPLFDFLPDPLHAAASHGVAIVVAFVIVTMLHVIFGELAPKTLALQRAESVAIAVIRPLRAFELIFRPAVLILNGLGRAVLRAFGLDPSAAEENLHSPEELKMLARASSRAGLIKSAQGSMLARALTLGERRVAAYITPRREIEWINIDDSLETIRAQIAASPHFLFPVRRDHSEEPLGILSAKRIFVFDQSKGGSVEKLVEPALFIPESVSPFGLLETFRSSGHRFALVIDEYGTLSGIVTATDLFEALVGELEAEANSGEGSAAPATDEIRLIEGGMPIDEFNWLYDREQLTDKDGVSYQTIAGFVLSQLRRVPSPGDRFVFDNLEFEVTRVERNRIEEIAVKRVSGNGSTLPRGPLPQEAGEPVRD